jgi:RNA polymerase sigma-70 factor (ECF subfamily)
MADSLDLGQLAAQHERLRRLARALTWDEHAAEDLTQDAWVLALERGPRDRSALGGWLARVTRRLASNARRGSRRREEREREAARPEALPSSAEIAARVEVEARLYAALERLPEPHRTLLRDRYLGDLSPEALARRDGLTYDAVKSRLARARAALRTQLEREGLGGDDRKETVHWLQALSPLVLGPRPVSAPPVDVGPLVSAGATGYGGLSLAAALAALATMKSLAVIAVAAVLGLALWGGFGTSPDVTPPTDALGPAAGPDALVLAPPSSSTSDTAPAEARRARASAAPSETSATAARWHVTGRFETREVGVSGVAFTLTMHRGFTLDGELLASFELTTDAGGDFALDLDPPRTSVCFDVEVAPEASRVFSIRRPYLAPLGDPEPVIRVEVVPLDAHVAGRVLGPDGEPVSGARVWTNSREAHTLADGRFSLPATSSRWNWVRATAEGLGMTEHQLEALVPGTTVDIELRLGRGARITGTVTDELGRPLQRVEVRVTGDSSAAVTDGNGRYELAHVDSSKGARTVTVWARGEGVLPGQADVALDPTVPAAQVDFTLARGAEVRGRVVDLGARPVVGAEVWLEWVSSDGWGSVTTRSGDDGEFVLMGCHPGPVEYGARKNGFADDRRTGEVRGEEQLLIQLAPARSLRGRVTSTNDAPVAGVRIAARQGRYYVGETATVERSGAFELGGLPSAGPLRLEAYGAQFLRTEVDVPEGETDDIAILLGPAGLLAGRVVDSATGAPIEAFKVRIGWPTIPVEGPALRSIGSTWLEPGKTFNDSDGHWSTGEHDELVPGQHAMVEVEAPGYATARIEAVRIAAQGEAEPLVHVLTRPVDVEVVLRSTPGDAPIERAVVTAARSQHPLDGERTWQAESGAAGVALLREVTPGALFLRVQQSGRAEFHAGRFDVPAGGTRIELDFPRGRDVEVVVRDAAGRTVLDARVVLVGDDAETARFGAFVVAADATGVARFASVAPGAWRVGRHFGRHAGPTYDLVDAFTVGAEPIGPLRITLAPLGSVTLRVLFEGSVEVPDGTLVRVTSEGGSTSQRAAEVASGAITIDGLLPGRYRIDCALWSETRGVTTPIREFEVSPTVKDVQIVLQTDP